LGAALPAETALSWNGLSGKIGLFGFTTGQRGAPPIYPQWPGHTLIQYRLRGIFE